jgi:hypothetical protein
MMNFHVTCNVDKLLKSVKVLHKEQLPYAMKEATNTVAFKARKALIEDYPKRFTVRSKGLPNLIRVDKADKNKQWASVYLDKLFMVRQEYGGDKVAKPGKGVAIPQEGVTEKGLDAKGGVKKGYYVSALLEDARRNKRTRHRNGGVYTENLPKPRKSNKYHPFEMECADGVRYIALHVEGAKYNKSEKQYEKLEWMYVLHPKIFVPKRWGWQKLVMKIFKSNIAGAFYAAYSKALKTEK